jgi:hypothetical protein
MDTNMESKKALSIIRRCIATERFEVSWHFTRRMDQRGLVWPDVLAVIHKPSNVHPDGFDRFNRPKWVVEGTAADGLPIGIVCALDVDDRGDVTVFITIY